MGSSESKAQVIDESDEYRNVPVTIYDDDISSTSSSNNSGQLMQQSVSCIWPRVLADRASDAQKVFSLVAHVMETRGEETNHSLQKCFKAIKRAQLFCEGAGVVLNLIVDDAVASQLDKIYEEIRAVRSEIKELEGKMKWETTRLEYAEICNTIVTGMKYCKHIQRNARNYSRKHDYEERLKELCSNQRFTLAMNTLLDGVTGKGDFRIDLLKLIYYQTNGSRPDVMRMAGRLLQLLTGGMTALLTYETLVRGRDSAKELEKAVYADRVREAEQCYANVIQLCVDASKENMANDIDRICEGKRCDDLPKEICRELARKYDWLRFQVMGYRNGVLHCHGSRIEKEIIGYRAGSIVCFYTSKHASLKTFSSAQKSQMDEIISKRHRNTLSAIRIFLVQAPSDKPDGYDPVIEYMNQISDKRQCWVVGASVNPDHSGIAPYGEYRDPLDVYHDVSEGSYQHMIKKCRNSAKYCFVSMFFQD